MSAELEGRAFEHTSALALPPIGPDVVLGGSGEGVFREPPGERRVYRRLPPEFHDDPDGAGVFRPFHAAVPVTYPPGFVVSARDVHLAGYRTLLTSDGRFFNDQPLPDPAAVGQYLDRLALPGRYFNEETGLRRDAETESSAPERFTLACGGRQVEHLPGTVVVLTSTEPYNYGSLLFRALPKLATLRALGSDARLLIYAVGATYWQHLALAGVPEERVIAHDLGRIYRIDHAIVPGQRNPQGFLDAATRGLYAEIRERHGGGARGRRIYASRLGYYPGVGRHMLNEAELAARLEALGFDILQTHAMDSTRQVQAFAGAELVVGPAGSAMFNTVFCRPGTRVIDIESEPHWIHTHACLFSSCELRWGLFEGKTLDRDFRRPHKPFTVNIEALLARIAAFT